MGIAAGKPINFEEQLVFPAGEVWTNTIYAPIRNTSNTITHVIGTAFDITAQKQRELAHQQEQHAIIQYQSQVLSELSTPLLTLTDNLIVMPLVGAIDPQRAQQIIESLLSGVSEQQAATVIIDITGVGVVDEQVANALLQAAQAVRLLGAAVVITGIRPEIAQTLVALDAPKPIALSRPLLPL